MTMTMTTTGTAMANGRIGTLSRVCLSRVKKKPDCFLISFHYLPLLSSTFAFLTIVSLPSGRREAERWHHARIISAPRLRMKAGTGVIRLLCCVNNHTVAHASRSISVADKSLGRPIEGELKQMRLSIGSRLEFRIRAYAFHRKRYGARRSTSCTRSAPPAPLLPAMDHDEEPIELIDDDDDGLDLEPIGDKGKKVDANGVHLPTRLERGLDILKDATEKVTVFRYSHRLPSHALL